MTKSNLGLLRIIGLLEGISYLALLGIAMPLKYIWNYPDAIYSTGMAHGILFSLYVFFVLIVAIQNKWNLKISFVALVASVVPLGTFIVDKKIFRREAENTEVPVDMN